MDLSTREGRRRQGARIKEAAREAGLTLDELARQIGCSRALIFQYASGASLAQSDRLQQIASGRASSARLVFPDADAHLPEDPARSAETRLSPQSRRALQASGTRLPPSAPDFEQRQVRDDIARLEALLAAYSAPVDYRKVVDCCQQLQPLLAHEADGERPAAVLFKQGNALIQLQEWGQAREKLEEAAAMFRQAGNPIAERDALQSLGHANLMLGRVEEALQQFEFVASGAGLDEPLAGHALPRRGARGRWATTPPLSPTSKRRWRSSRSGERLRRPSRRVSISRRTGPISNWISATTGARCSALSAACGWRSGWGCRASISRRCSPRGVAALHLGDPAAALRSVQQALDAAP